MSWLIPDWVTGFDRENYEAGLEADRKNLELQRKLNAAGKVTDDDLAISEGRYLESVSYDPDEEIETAFGEGIDEGADNIRGGLTSTINTVIGTPLKLIPWQVWLAAALYGAWRLGLLDGLLKGVLKKAR